MRHNGGVDKPEPDTEHELWDPEAAREAQLRRDLAMTPQERLIAMDSFCYELTLLASTARRVT